MESLNEPIAVNGGRHAYLIMAHHHWAQLVDLLEMLDDGRNDIYLHIDLKAGDVPLDPIRRAVRKGNLVLTPRMDVTWGGDTLVRCQLELLKTAAPGHYGYYHLLSGDDLPLKSQDEIHEFFEKNRGWELVSVSPLSSRKDWIGDLKYYYFFQNMKYRKSIWRWAYRLCNHCSLFFQKALRIDRTKKHPAIYRQGSNWFSITDGLAQYLLSEDVQDMLWRLMRWTRLPDEKFLQTIVCASPYREKLFLPDGGRDVEASWNGRMVNWKGGKSPDIYTMKDIGLLKDCRELFARKFSMEVDPDVIREIKASVLMEAD